RLDEKAPSITMSTGRVNVGKLCARVIWKRKRSSSVTPTNRNLIMKKYLTCPKNSAPKVWIAISISMKYRRQRAGPDGAAIKFNKQTLFLSFVPKHTRNVSRDLRGPG